MNHSLFSFLVSVFFYEALALSFPEKASDIGHQASGRRQEASEVMVGAWEVWIAPATAFGFMKCKLR
jgi:hypothetical protein